MIRIALRAVLSQLAALIAVEAALVDWLGRSYLGELLDADVRIFEYKDFMLHAKTATVDGVWSTIGSSNVDTLSFFGLHESNLEKHSERLAARMERMFELDKTNAREVTLKAWKERPAYDKALQWGSRPYEYWTDQP